MKFPVSCFLGVLFALSAAAQTVPFSVYNSATMLEHRSSFQLVQLGEDAAGGLALMALGGHDGTAATHLEGGKEAHARARQARKGEGSTVDAWLPLGVSRVKQKYTSPNILSTP